ncbi:MAG: hypothetical protein KAH54_07245 [Candidatus Sabulitectum sp.]|nr:hypothetical protein [Candidatus Sabulitectum sp.]
MITSFAEESSIRKNIVLLFLFSLSAFAGAIILYTSDGGTSWLQEESNTVFNLNDVALSIVNNTAVAVGDNGTILRRGEHGIWADVSPEGLSADLFSVAVGVSSMMACGADGILLSSFDGGNNWCVLSEFEYGGTDLYSVNFDPTHPNSFLITGENGFVYSSVDGLVQTGTNSDLVASCGMLCSGFPELVLGREGECYFLGTREPYNIEDAVIRGATEIVSGGGRYIAVGENGSVIRYSNLDIWDSIVSGTGEYLNDVSYLTWGMTACAVGENGTVLVSGDNGFTWERVNVETTRDLTAVAGNGAGVACIVGRNALFDVLNGIPFIKVSP